MPFILEKSALAPVKLSNQDLHYMPQTTKSFLGKLRKMGGSGFFQKLKVMEEVARSVAKGSILVSNMCLSLLSE